MLVRGVFCENADYRVFRCFAEHHVLSCATVYRDMTTPCFIGDLVSPVQQRGSTMHRGPSRETRLPRFATVFAWSR